MMHDSEPVRSPRWPLLRIKPGHDTQIELLSVGWLKLSTHYHERTHICLGNDECLACRYLPRRDYWYLPVKVGTQPHILELSAFSAADLEQSSRMYWGRFVAGQQVLASRRGPKAPIRFAPLEANLLEKQPPVDIWVSAVMAIFGLPGMEQHESLDEYRARLWPYGVARTEALAAQFEKGSTRSTTSL